MRKNVPRPRPSYVPNYIPIERARIQRVANQHLKELEKLKHRPVPAVKQPIKQRAESSSDTDDDSGYCFQYTMCGIRVRTETSAFPTKEEMARAEARRRKRARKEMTREGEVSQLSERRVHSQRSMSQSSDDVQIIGCTPPKQSANASAECVKLEDQSNQRAGPSSTPAAFKLPQLKNSTIRSAVTAATSLPPLLNGRKSIRATDEQFANLIKRKIADEGRAELANYDDEPEIHGFEISATGNEISFTSSYDVKEKIIAKCKLNGALKNVSTYGAPVPLPQIAVDIIKPGSTLRVQLCLYMGQTAKEVLFKIENYYIVEGTDDKTYIPPAFSMDAEIYNQLIEYLNERNINLKFCHDVVNFCIYYEHQVYTEHLSSLQKFLLK